MDNSSGFNKAGPKNEKEELLLKYAPLKRYTEPEPVKIGEEMRNSARGGFQKYDEISISYDRYAG